MLSHSAPHKLQSTFTSLPVGLPNSSLKPCVPDLNLNSSLLPASRTQCKYPTSLQIVLKSYVFSFDGQIYKQIQGKIREQEQQEFRVAIIKHDDSKVLLYTGFTCYGTLDALFTFLGPSVRSLCYSKIDSEKRQGNFKRCHPQKLPPLEEFFVTLVRLRLGLMEQDLAFWFGISQSTVSRITTTWLNSSI